MQRYYTSIEQSKKLLKLGLNPETADMYWAVDANIVVAEPYITKTETETLIPAYVSSLPCWSVGALLDVLDYPKFYKDNTSGKDLWHCRCNINEREIVKVSFAETEIDAVVELVVNLLEFGLLKNKK